MFFYYKSCMNFRSLCRFRNSPFGRVIVPPTKTFPGNFPIRNFHFPFPVGIIFLLGSFGGATLLLICLELLLRAVTFVFILMFLARLGPNKFFLFVGALSPCFASDCGICVSGGYGNFVILSISSLELLLLPLQPCWAAFLIILKGTDP